MVQGRRTDTSSSCSVCIVAARYVTGDNVKRIMATEGINPDKDPIKAAYVVPKGFDGMKMVSLAREPSVYSHRN